MLRRRCFTAVFQPLALTVFPPCPWQCSLNFRAGEWERCAFRAEHSAVTLSQHSDQLCPFINHCPLQTVASLNDMESSTSPGYKHKCLEGLSTCPFRETAVVSSCLGPVTSPVTGYWPGLQYQAWNPTCGAGLKSSQRVVGYSCKNGATIASLDVTCLSGQVSNVAFSLPGKRIDGYSPPVTCMPPSSTRKARKQGGSFRLSSQFLGF